MKLFRCIFVLWAVVMLCGCSKENTPEKGDAIALQPTLEGSVKTRASLCDDEIGLRDYRCHIYSYLSGSPTIYFDSDLQYSDENQYDASTHKWSFHGDGGYKSYYWPLATSLDFFAIAPLPHPAPPPVYSSYVTVDQTSNPPTFAAQMPLNATGEGDNQENITEVMCAYTPGRTSSQGAVPLEFKHPFAAIVFKVGQSHRDLTVNNIVIKDINYTGTCAIDNSGNMSWNLGADRGDLEFNIAKIIPGQVNFGAELCNPYLVLPQTNAGDDNKKTFTVECHWKGYDTADNTKTLTGTISNNWEASKVYIYTLDLGNSREEILFKVTVAPWEYIYDHEFEIE